MRHVSIGVAAAVLALAAAGCSSGHSSASSPSTVFPVSGTIPHGTVVAPTTVAPTPTTAGRPSGPTVSTLVTIAGSGTYGLAVTSATGSGPCPSPGLGGSYVAFEVAVTNRGSGTEPLARVGLSATPADGGGAREVAAISYDGVCTNFTEPGGTLRPGQTVSYRGTVSGVSSPSTLTADVISTPQNATLASVSLAING